MFSYQSGFAHPTQPVDEPRFWSLVRATKWNENIDMFRSTGDASYKRKLPAFIFQATFDETESKAHTIGCWRKQSSTRLTGLVVMDVDHVEDVQQVWATQIKPLDLKALGILLVYITPSGHGLKIVFKADAAKGNLIDNQLAMGKVLGLVVDESCKDASRMSFICKEGDILYIDSELFEYRNVQFAEMYEEDYRNGKSGPTKEESDVGINPARLLPAKSGEGDGEPEPLSFKGRPYSDIIQSWWQRLGGEPQPGERNVKLHQLAVNLRAICDNDKELLLKIMPRLGLDDQEVARIVDSACKEEPKGISKPMREILGMNAQTTTIDNNMTNLLWEWGQAIEALSGEYPIIRDLTKGLKYNQYPAALFVGGGLLMTLMTRCTYSFYDRPEEKRRLNNSTYIIGDPASGKSFATRLYRILSAPIVEADKVGRDAINAYREIIKTKGANKEKPAKPKVVIRVHPARTSNAQFIQDMVNAVEVVDGEEMQLHMLTFDTELDNTVTVQKGGAWIDKQSLELKAFHNEEDGQAYSNADSVLQDFNVTWNFIYTGTPLALRKKVTQQNFGSGLATRLSVIPLPSTRFRMMDRRKVIDEESDARLREWAYKLDRTKGLLPLDRIVDELYDWTERRMADAEYNDCEADEMLLKRCAYHGINFAAPFIMMRHWNKLRKEGDFWCGEFETDEVDWMLAELIVNIQFACQKYFFGAMAEAYFDNKSRDAATNVQRRQKTREGFERLPEVFTYEDVMNCFTQSNERSARVTTSRMIRDHLIEKVSDQYGKATFRKLTATL